MTRQAIMCVSRELLEAVMPDWASAARTRYMELLCQEMSDEEKLKRVIEPYHRALKLPANCNITGVAVGYRIDRDQIAFRVECPDFVETPRGQPLPEVRAVYQNSLVMNIRNPSTSPDRIEPGSAEVVGESGYFLCWDGEAVETRKVYGPTGSVLIEEGPKLCPPPAPTWNGLPVVKTGIKNDWNDEPQKQSVPHGPCWVCGNPTPRSLGDTYECLHCSTKPLL